ncbi:MAG: pyrimidine 5'-nucleotidase [Rhodocyclaceae bacterium]|nr:MAG: pyrimidine 5'-nucleotidase [Rhodocyclaceae bacterium]
MTTPVWLFDLDDTLHDASAHIFPHINRAMTAYVAEHLQVDEAEANRLRMDYWRRYGATLTGLMRHHGTDPHHFLWHTHQFPEFHEQLVFDGAVKAVLRTLPGRKIVFSNAPGHYARRVLNAMGILHLFDGIWCLEELRFVPKPFPSAFRRLLQRERLTARDCIMVEDSLPNLHTARRLGMKTVLISRQSRTPSWVDVKLASVLALPRQLGRLC